MQFLLVGIGGFFGAICRYLIFILMQSLQLSSLPLATLVVNVLGSFVAGLLFSKLENSSPLFLLLNIGFLGAFTTFSAFAADSIKLLQSNFGLALLNVLANMVLSLGAFWIGRFLFS